MEFLTSVRRKMYEVWPTVYQVINGFVSFVLRTGKSIGTDVLNEFLGKH